MPSRIEVSDGDGDPRSGKTHGGEVVVERRREESEEKGERVGVLPDRICAKSWSVELVGYLWVDAPRRELASLTPAVSGLSESWRSAEVLYARV